MASHDQVSDKDQNEVGGVDPGEAGRSPDWAKPELTHFRAGDAKGGPGANPDGVPGS